MYPHIIIKQKWLNNIIYFLSVFDAKRLIGRDFSDQTVQRDMKHWPFDIVENGKKPKIQVEFKCEKKTFTPEEISSMVSLNKNPDFFIK